MPAERVRRNNISDDGLQYLTAFPGLHSLSLKATRVSDAGLQQYLPELAQLDRVDFSYLDISDSAAEALRSLSWLRDLNLRHTAVSGPAILSLVQDSWQSLKRLNVANTEVSDATLAEFPAESGIECLNLGDTAITDDGLPVLVQLKNLETLRLDHCRVTDDGLRCLADCASLKKLQLWHSQAGDASLVWLCDTGIQELGLGKTVITDAGMPTVLDFPSLQILDLVDTSVTNRGMRFLDGAEGLNTLYLEYSQVTGAALPSLAELPLRTLSLTPDGNDTEFAQFRRFSDLKNLAIFDGTCMTRALCELPQLQVLLLVHPGNITPQIAALKELRYLLIVSKKTDPDRIAGFRAELPQCHIRFYRSAIQAQLAFRSLARRTR